MTTDTLQEILDRIEAHNIHVSVYRFSIPHMKEERWQVTLDIEIANTKIENTGRSSIFELSLRRAWDGFSRVFYILYPPVAPQHPEEEPSK